MRFERTQCWSPATSTRSGQLSPLQQPRESPTCRATRSSTSRPRNPLLSGPSVRRATPTHRLNELSVRCPIIRSFGSPSCSLWTNSPQPSKGDADRYAHSMRGLDGVSDSPRSCLRRRHAGPGDAMVAVLHVDRTANLPRPLTRLVGRRRELAALRDAILLPDVSLVTLTGPGGVGKTRLATEAAAALVEDLPDGVVFVPLTAIRDPELVLPTIALAFGVHETGDQSVKERLLSVLRDRALLLVLDNFEQVIGAAPQLGELLAACRHLTVLT